MHAATVGIVGYDVLSADISGTGNWFHTCTGLITPLSETRANYNGGTGTMADGVSTGTTAANTQLFYALMVRPPPVSLVALASCRLG